MPVEETTITRALELSLMSFTSAGSSFQNGRFIALNASGRSMTMWAMASEMVREKQVMGRANGEWWMRVKLREVESLTGWALCLHSA